MHSLLGYDLGGLALCRLLPVFLSGILILTGNQASYNNFPLSNLIIICQMEVLSPGPFEIINPLSQKMQLPARGHQWPKQELIKYAVFMAYHNIHNMPEEDHFQSWSFFRKLSLFVQSKNPNQCRIFHKKMMNDHLTINSLICQLKTTIHKF